MKIYGFDGKLLMYMSTSPTLDQEIRLDAFPNGSFILEIEAENQQISRTKIQILR